jgi:co-chaperonin GroES (HSP10)
MKNLATQTYKNGILFALEKYKPKQNKYYVLKVGQKILEMEITDNLKEAEDSDYIFLYENNDEELSNYLATKIINWLYL